MLRDIVQPVSDLNAGNSDNGCVETYCMNMSFPAQLTHKDARTYTNTHAPRSSNSKHTKPHAKK